MKDGAHLVLRVDETNLGLFGAADVYVLPGNHVVLVGPDGVFLKGIKQGGIYYFKVEMKTEPGKTYFFRYTKGRDQNQLLIEGSEICAFVEGDAEARPVACSDMLVRDTTGTVQL